MWDAECATEHFLAHDRSIFVQLSWTTRPARCTERHHFWFPAVLYSYVFLACWSCDISSMDFQCFHLIIFGGGFQPHATMFSCMGDEASQSMYSFSIRSTLSWRFQ